MIGVNFGASDYFTQRHNILQWCARARANSTSAAARGCCFSIRVQTGLTCERRRQCTRQSGRSILMCARAFCCLHFVSPSSRAIFYFILRPGQTTTRASPVITVTSNKKGWSWSSVCATELPDDATQGADTRFSIQTAEQRTPLALNPHQLQTSLDTTKIRDTHESQFHIYILKSHLGEDDSSYKPNAF